MTKEELVSTLKAAVGGTAYRLLYCLQYPVVHLSRIQMIYPRAK